MTFTPFSAECEYCKRVLNTGEEKLVQLSASNIVSNSYVPVNSTCMVHMCQNCHKNLTTLLGKVKREGSWGNVLEQDKGLAEEVQSLKRQLQFLRLWDESLLSDRPEDEAVTITTKDGQILHAHRTVLVSYPHPNACKFRSFFLSIWEGYNNSTDLTMMSREEFGGIM